jgi:hypothetical protein
MILPAIQSDETLPVNGEGAMKLAAAIARLATPTPEAVPALPETAAQISGQTYTFEANDLGWDSLSMTFDEGANTAQLSLNGEPPLMIGVDNVDQINHVNDDQKAIFAIGFDNILRVNAVAGAEPMLMRGQWPKDNRFSIRIELQGTVNWYQLTLTFNDQEVNVAIRNGISGTTEVVSGTAA